MVKAGGARPDDQDVGRDPLLRPGTRRERLQQHSELGRRADDVRGGERPRRERDRAEPAIPVDEQLQPLRSREHLVPQVDDRLPVTDRLAGAAVRGRTGHALHHEHAAALLDDWDDAVRRFTEVMPSDFKRVLEAKAEALEEGLTEDETAAKMMEALHG